jgi:hypothetical protein
MSSNIARDGRRRRFLNDESRITAGAQAALAINTVDSADAPRYGEMASIEHHPQISDYVPRRKRAVLAALAGGAAVAGGAEALTHSAIAIASALPGASPEQVSAQLAGGLVAWTSAIALLAVAGLARLIYSLRRHRVDDVRGRYRIWKWIAWGGLGLSVNAVVGLHTIVASVAATATGWSLTAGGAEWWLAPLALVGGWMAVRLALETGESRSSLAMLVLAGGCYLIGAAGALGWTPAWIGPWDDALVNAVPLMGHALAVAAMMLFARYVVLDVQGLIDHAPRPAKQPAAKKQATAPSLVSADAAPLSRREAAPAVAARQQTLEEDEEDAEDEEANGRFLSKSERKRLRKQQQRRAA